MKNVDIERKYYTVNELADLYGVSRTTIYKWVRKGMPHETTPGGRKRFNVEDINKWSQNREDVK